MFYWVLVAEATQDSGLIDTIDSELLDSLPGNFSYFEVDELGQIYGLRDLGDHTELVKIISGEEQPFKYSNETIGTLYSIDVSNPFFLLLFYKEYQQLIYLDRTLSEVGQLSFGDLDRWDVNAVCLSQSGDIWVWEEGTFHLQKINKDGKLITESHDLRLVLDQPVHFIRLQAYEDKLYALDKDQGLYVFDVQGQLDYLIPVKGVSDFFVYQNKIFYLKDECLFYYLLKNNTHHKLPFQIDPFLQVRTEPRGIWLLNKKGIYLFGQDNKE